MEPVLEQSTSAGNEPLSQHQVVMMSKDAELAERVRIKAQLIEAWQAWCSLTRGPHLISDFHTGRVIPDPNLVFSLEETLAIIFAWERESR
ncbi:MAG: hypothetical protein KDI36_17335 [Pseudomonadales bacterium]|nr:hypothetical protein [Pseudomonadales bacterium]